MEIDYRIPFEYRTITIQNVPNPQGGITRRVITGLIRNQWRNISYIEKFVFDWMFPNNDDPKTCIVMYNGTSHIVLAPYAEVALLWEEYKIWESKKDIMIFNKHN